MISPDGQLQAAKEILTLLISQSNQLTQECSDALMRRAISTAYYAVFHLLNEAVSNQIATDSTLRDQARRTLSHTDMDKVAKWFSKGQKPLEDILKPHGIIFQNPPTNQPIAAIISQELFDVCETFVDLQSVRHEADYNPVASFTLAEASDNIQEAESLFAAWRTFVNDPQWTKIREVFLISLLLGGRLNR